MNRDEMLRLGDAELQRAQEILESRHACEMGILKAIRQIYKPNRKNEVTTMSTERDTHFAGFAKLLWDDLMQANGLGYIFVDEDNHDDGIVPTNYRLLIAQRAYDLLAHDRMNSGTIDLQSAGSYLEAAEMVNGIPDLTKWPVEGKSRKGASVVRTIKFSIVLQHEETGRVVHRVFSYADIFNGTAKDEIGKLEGYAIIAQRQYTDLKDKQGKEIYEEDIVVSGLTGNRGKIVFAGYAFRIKSITGQWGGELRMFEYNHLEIIGNIYENPELLTEGN